MKKLAYLSIAVIMMAGVSCSRVNTSTSNNIPTTNAYEASMRSNNAAAGTAPVDASSVAIAQADEASGSMLFETRMLTESMFLMESASASMLQVALARLALDRSQDPQVKGFAQMMLDHHTKAALEMSSISSDIQVTLPTALLPMHQKVMDRLSKLTGTKFDEKYMDEMEEMHQSEVAKYEVVSNNAPTVSVKAFAIRALPSLRVHLNEADKLEDKVD